MPHLTEQEYIDLYIEQLDDIEKIVLQIAVQHLESSLDISKSIGFIEWKQKIILNK